MTSYCGNYCRRRESIKHQRAPWGLEIFSTLSPKASAISPLLGRQGRCWFTAELLGDARVMMGCLVHKLQAEPLVFPWAHHLLQQFSKLFWASASTTEFVLLLCYRLCSRQSQRNDLVICNFISSLMSFWILFFFLCCCCCNRYSAHLGQLCCGSPCFILGNIP